MLYRVKKLAVPLLLLTGWLVGCGRSTPDPASYIPTAELRAAYTRVADHLHATSAGHASGWPSDTGCDGALWAGEARAGGADWVSMSASLQSDGRPTRRPGQDCGPATGDSEATTSTDMQLGILLGLLSARDSASLLRMQQYVDANHGVVGTPASDIPLTYMKPGTRTLLARAVAATGGPREVEWVVLPVVSSIPTADSELHLQLITLVLKMHLGGLDPVDSLAAAQLLAGHPNDALAHYTAGDMAGAATIALAPGWTVPSYVRDAPEYADSYRLFVLNLLCGDFG